MASNTNKTKEVLKHLQTYGTITSIEAIDLFGATRLSAIIFNLRKRGYNIISVDKVTKDRYGHTVPYSEYTLTQGTAQPQIAVKTPEEELKSWFEGDDDSG
jgi:hypothetical protein